MFEQDAKNYHVWSYRQWLVRRFELWDQGELAETEKMIDEDVRNNSAWNHRFFLVNGRQNGSGVKDKSIAQREIRFAQEAIRKTPQNQSPWNYLRGTLNTAGLPLNTTRDFAEGFASLDHEDKITSSHALDLLAEIYASEEGRKDEARQAYELLALKYDPIRANYWNYLKSRVEVKA